MGTTDHILVSPELAGPIVPGSAFIHHRQPAPSGMTGVLRDARGADHPSPSVTLEL